MSFLALFIPGQVQAANPPGFPSCETPEGKVISEYENGEHGILGSNVLHSGKDTVWEIDDDRVLQCYCPKAGDGDEGVQTVFWRFREQLSVNEIESLKNQGWFYIASGSAWGLKADPYMARNHTYTCRNKPGNGGGGEILGAYTATGSSKQTFVIVLVALSSLFAYIKLSSKSSNK